MSDDKLSQVSDLELEFIAEEKGHGSLSPHISDGTENSYVGYDIHPEDIEALFFEGIGVPRWESIKADTVEQQTALYMQRYNEIMSNFPMVGRANDTEQNTEYTSDEVARLLEECERIMKGTSDPKAVRALQKMSLAGNKAAAHKVGLALITRQESN